MKKIIICVFSLLGIRLTVPPFAEAIEFGENLHLSIGEMGLLIVFQIIVLFIASKIVNIEQRDFWKAVSSVLGIAVLFFFMFVFTAGKDLQDLGVFIMGILAVFVIERVYNTTLIKALAAFLLTLVATAIAVFVLFAP